MRISMLLLLAMVLIFVILPDLLSGQPPIPDGPDQTPIDGGLGVLAAAGGMYALKKLRDRKKD